MSYDQMKDLLSKFEAMIADQEDVTLAVEFLLEAVLELVSQVQQLRRVTGQDVLDD